MAVLTASTAMVVGVPAAHATAWDAIDDGASGAGDHYRFAVDARLSFDVPAGSLQDVVAEIARQAGASVSMAVAVDTVEARGIRGRMTLVEALTRVLEGTGWMLVSVEGGVISLGQDSDDHDGATIVVTAQRSSFVERDSSMLTRNETPLRQTPGTINAVSEEVIKSQNAVTLEEALRNVPGIAMNTTLGLSRTTIGGFVYSQGNYVGGLAGGDTNGLVSVSDLESVEVLKGPASILTGADTGGGVVNYVPKRADGAERREIAAGVGSGSEFLGTYDVGGPLFEGAGVNFRVTGQSQFAERLPGGGNNPHAHLLSAMIGARQGRFEFDLGVRVADTRRANPGRVQFIPETGEFRDYGAAINPDEYAAETSKRLTYGLSGTIVDGDSFKVKLRARGLAQQGKGVSKVQLFFPFGDEPTLVYGSWGAFDSRQLSQYVDIFTQYESGSFKHKAILAFDYSDRRFLSKYNSSSGLSMGAPVPLPDANDALPWETNEVRQKGLVFQNQVDIGPVHALVGLRQNWYFGSTTEPAFGRETEFRSSKFLPSGGIVVDLSSQLSAYASHQNSFYPTDPASVPTQSGEIIAPESRKRYEFGFKTGLMGDRLVINGSYYWFNTSNSIEPVGPPVDGRIFFRNGPGLKGKGYELSVTGDITPTLQIIGGYAYQAVKTVAGKSVIEGPRHTANLWMTNSIKFDDANVITVGGGFHYNSGSKGYSIFDNSRREFIDTEHAFLEVNAAVGVTLGRTQINLTLSNILNRENYEPVERIEMISKARPRVFRLVVTQPF